MYKQLTRLATAAAVAACFSLPAAATGYTTNYGTIDLSALGDQGYSLDAYFTKGTTFTDHFAFLIDSSTPSATGWLTATFGKNYNFAGFSGSLTYKDTAGTAVWTQTFSMDKMLPQIYEEALLSAGTYELTLTGTATGTSGGEYHLFASAVPVPEPGEWAMMLAGVAMMGVMVRRRRPS